MRRLMAVVLASLAAGCGAPVQMAVSPQLPVMAQAKANAKVQDQSFRGKVRFVWRDVHPDGPLILVDGGRWKALFVVTARTERLLHWGGAKPPVPDTEQALGSNLAVEAAAAGPINKQIPANLAYTDMNPVLAQRLANRATRLTVFGQGRLP